MISITVNLNAEESDRLIGDLISSLTGPKAAELNAIGGRAAQQAAAKYHREFDQNARWRGTRYLGPSKVDGSAFGADVARGWKFDASDRTGADISNDARHYAFKVRGGTITPKRAKFLTIPLVPDAKGKYAADFVRDTGLKLFQPRGKRVLAVKDGKGIRSIYALVASVTLAPWRNALPPSRMLADAFGKAVLAEYKDFA
jgi:hypothetical protein